MYFQKLSFPFLSSPLFLSSKNNPLAPPLPSHPIPQRFMLISIPLTSSQQLAAMKPAYKTKR